MIASCVCDGKRFDKSDGIGIERPQIRCQETAPVAGTFFAFFLHAARIMRSRYGFKIVAMWETRFGERIEFVYLLEWPDEAAKTAAWAAFMADATARLTRRLAVVVTSAGPGFGNALTGLLNSYWDGAPVLLISGDSPSTTRGPPFGTKRSGANPPERASSYSRKNPSTFSSPNSASATWS